MESFIFCTLLAILLSLVPIYFVLCRIAKCLETFSQDISQISFKIGED